MKSALLAFFAMTFCPVFACAAANAATSGDATAQQNARTFSQPADHALAANKNNRRGTAIVAKPNHPQLPPGNQKRLATGKLSHPQGPVSSRSTGPANGVLSVNKAASTRRFVQPLGMSRASIPAYNNVRHRNPNPATVGGPTSSRDAHTGSVNGTRMGRRP